MSLPHLTDEQIRTWSNEEKDRWWLQNVFRGNMPQLTLRAAITGFLLGGILSATNLYVGAKTGWTLGVGLTSVILAFALFRALSRVGLARDMTILENNCMQSIATAAGYMTGPLISGMAAYMWVLNTPMTWWQMLSFNVVLSVLGVLVAFPLKRRFINHEQQPFPEGRACGVVLHTLYTSAAAVGLFKAKALLITALLAAMIEFLKTAAFLQAIHACYWMMSTWNSWKDTLVAFKGKIAATWHLPENLAGLYSWLGKHGLEPKIAGISFQQLGLNPSLDLAMVGAGGLMGFRVALSMLIGMLVNFAVLAPWMISIGEIQPKSINAQTGEQIFGRVHILNNWSLWWGIVMMVAASMVALFARPEVFVEAFRGLFGKRSETTGKDPLAHIELPLWISIVGIPIVGAVGVWMAHDWFGVSWVFGASAIPLIIFLTLIASSSTAMTGITPTGSLSKIPQFLFGALDPKHPPTNLMTGVMCVEVASNASNLLMDIKPGYMLGGKPRQQAIGHLIGIIAGALASTPLFFVLFMSDYDPKIAAENPNHVQEIMAPEGGQFSFPSALQWKGVSDLVTSIFGGAEQRSLLTPSIQISMFAALFVAIALEIWRIASGGRMPISPLAVGLGVVIPPDSTMAMFFGAAFFAWMSRRYVNRPNTAGWRLWVDTQEPICAGLIAGAALTGIAGKLIEVFLLDTGH